MALSDTIQKPITGEKLLKMGDIGRCELVRGEITRMSPTGGRHGKIANWIATLLTNHVREQKLGDIYAAETGFYTQRNPDTIRAPDTMFVSKERAAQISDPIKFLDVAPDLAVEVLSPGDTWIDVEAKVDEYIQAGVRLVWVVDPDGQRIAAYRSSNDRTLLKATDQLSGEDVLPDFSVSIASIFEESV